MQEAFLSHIRRKALFNKRHHLLLAVSGGVDSVALAHLLLEGGFRFSLAHCNFKLRGSDSDADEAFCRDLAAQLGVEIYVTNFNTTKYAKLNKLSIQMAARQLRYDWFSTVLKDRGMDYLLTAHHAGDVVETVLVNLLRGTGIKGMTGIREKSGSLVRPLLPYCKAEIEAYAKTKKMAYRLDTSNLEDKYERNFLRHHIIPKLKELHPELEATFRKNAKRMAGEAELLLDTLEKKKKQLSFHNGALLTINAAKLRKQMARETILYHLLSPQGFNEAQVKDICRCLGQEEATGKLFYSPTHRLAINRDELLVAALNSATEAPVLIHSWQSQQLFKVSHNTAFTVPQKNELMLDPKRLVFPLTLRPAATGDKFRPFGMKGFKLLSDFFRQEKFSAFDKEACRLLVNGNGEIIWVVGHRSDERYRVNKNDESFLKLTLPDN